MERSEHTILERTVHRALLVQRPVVLAHLRSIQRRHPDASPAALVRVLERRYLAAVTGAGASIGAAAVIPGVGTGTALALSAVETVGFMEATALFAQSVAEVHGIAVTDPDRTRALVMTLMLGREGADLVRQFAAQAAGGGLRTQYWGELITSSLPRWAIAPIVDKLKSRFVHVFAAQGGASIIGKALPFGIGAAVGGTGNHLIGRGVVRASRAAFGAPPPIAPAQPGSGMTPSVHVVEP